MWSLLYSNQQKAYHIESLSDTLNKSNNGFVLVDVFQCYETALKEYQQRIDKIEINEQQYIKQGKYYSSNRYI